MLFDRYSMNLHKPVMFENTAFYDSREEGRLPVIFGASQRMSNH